MTDQLAPATCPACGGDDILHTESVPVDRRVLGVAPDGTLVIAGLAQPDYESGFDEEMGCQECGHHWPVPEKAEYR